MASDLPPSQPIALLSREHRSIDRRLRELSDIVSHSFSENAETFNDKLNFTFRFLESHQEASVFAMAEKFLTVAQMYILKIVFATRRFVMA
jgi:hypothetical protein